MPRAALRLVGAAYHHLLHLVELVDPVKPRGVLAGSASFTAEAGAHRGVSEWQGALRQNLVGVDSHQTHFAGAREKQIMAASAR